MSSDIAGDGWHVYLEYDQIRCNFMLPHGGTDALHVNQSELVEGRWMHFSRMMTCPHPDANKKRLFTKKPAATPLIVEFCARLNEDGSVDLRHGGTRIVRNETRQYGGVTSRDISAYIEAGNWRVEDVK